MIVFRKFKINLAIIIAMLAVPYPAYSYESDFAWVSPEKWPDICRKEVRLLREIAGEKLDKLYSYPSFKKVNQPIGWVDFHGVDIPVPIRKTGFDDISFLENGFHIRGDDFKIIARINERIIYKDIFSYGFNYSKYKKHGPQKKGVELTKKVFGAAIGRNDIRVVGFFFTENDLNCSEKNIYAGIKMLLALQEKVALAGENVYLYSGKYQGIISKYERDKNVMWIGNFWKDNKHVNVSIVVSKSDAPELVSLGYGLINPLYLDGTERVMNWYPPVGEN